MVIFDRGLILGSCLGEAATMPLIVLAIALALAGAAALLIRRFGARSLRFFPWLLAGVGVAISCLVGAVLAFGGITARIESADGQMTVTSCRTGAAERNAYRLSAIATRFVARANRKGPATPLARFSEGEREIAEVWLGHPGVDLDALSAIAPEAVAQYRRWQAP